MDTLPPEVMSMDPNTPIGPGRGFGWSLGTLLRKGVGTVRRALRALNTAPRWTVPAAAVAILAIAGGFYLAYGRHGINRPPHQVLAPVAHSRASRRASAAKASSPNTRAALMLPVAGQLAASYGWTYSSHLGEWYFNPGLTLRAPAGQTVHAAWAGPVLSVQQKPMMGLTVTVDDGGGVETVYGHLGKSLVAAGETVTQGAVIGTVGGPSIYSRDPAAHLDFQVWHGAVSVNPENYLKGSS